MTTAAPCDLILFGTLGDLARRKLLPALYQLDRAGLLHDASRIIGVARDGLSVSEYRQRVADSLGKFITKEPLDEAVVERFCARLSYCGIDLAELEAYAALTDHVDSSSRTVISYFATPPALFPVICDGLASIGLTEAPARVVLEKPLGHDLASSKRINQHVGRYFDESQIYRIDHYLGKETVLNLLALRFANSLFSSHWDHTD